MITSVIGSGDMQSSLGCASQAEFETDWINSNPIFFNTKTKAVSRNINDVIDWGDFKFDPIGLHNYLSYGYIIFGRTPVDGVERVGPHSSVSVNVADGKLSGIRVNPDPAIALLDSGSSVDKVLHLLRAKVGQLNSRLREDATARILLPLSGGNDSRLLALLVEDRSRVHAATYDISMSHKFSKETVVAKSLAKHLGIDWCPLPLRDFLNEDYIHLNLDLFGLEMPIHASYHLEFYNRLKSMFQGNWVVLSGSVGDWWSGEKVPLGIPEDHRELNKLFFNHGISMDGDYIDFDVDSSYNESVFESARDLLRESDTYRVLFARRGRVGLASFIMRSALNYFDAFTPFFDLEASMAQLKLDPEARKNRAWQSELFRSMGVSTEELLGGQVAKRTSGDCSLDLQAAYSRGSCLPPLQKSMFDGIIKPARIDWINSRLSAIQRIPLKRLQQISSALYEFDNKLPRVFPKKLFGHRSDRIYSRLINKGALEEAINEWCLLYPLQACLKRAKCA
jgi:hypothetical protein